MQRWFRYQHVIFDCDSTLSSIEGIDELARSAGVREKIKSMTDSAMSGEIELNEVYGKRLDLIKPSREMIYQLKHQYKQSIVDDAAQVIDLLKTLNHEVYIVSGGLYEPVREFGLSLGFNEENIRAVGVDYDQLTGQWWKGAGASSADWNQQYLNYHQTPLTLSEGKISIINQLLNEKNGRSILIGDGMSDLLAAQAVDQFVGFGGVITRENVKQQSQVYINSKSLLPVLALAGGQAMIEHLIDHQKALSDNVVRLLSDQTDFTNQKLKHYLVNLFQN